MRLFLRICTWLLMAFAGRCVAPAAAQTPADPARLMPEGTLAFVGWGGADGLAEPLKTTALGKMLAEPDVHEFSAKLSREVDQAIRRSFANKGGVTAKAANPLLSMLSIIWDRPCAIGLLDVDSNPDNPDRWDIALAVDTGRHRAAFARAVDQFIGLARVGGAQVKPLAEQGDFAAWTQVRTGPDAPTIAGAFAGDVFVFTIGKKSPELMRPVFAGGKSLVSNSEFAAVRTAMGSDSAPTAVSIFVNNSQRFRNRITAIGGTKDESTLMRALSLLLESEQVNSVGGAIQLADGGQRSTLYLHTAGPQTRLLSLLAGKPLADDDFLPAPADASFMYATNFDRATFNGEMGSGLDAWLGYIIQYSNSECISTATELFGSLGGTWVLFDAPSNGGMFLSGLTLCVKVADPARVKSQIGKLVAAIDRSGLPWNAAARGQMRTKTVRYGSHEVTFVENKAGTIPIAPAWSVDGDRLVVAMYPQMVRATLDRLSDKDARAKSILSNPWFMSGRKRLPADANAVAYFDTPRAMSDLYAVALPLAQSAMPFVRANLMDLDVSMIPSRESVLKHIFSSMSATRCDEHGILMVSHTSLPIINPSLTEAVLAGPLAAAIFSPVKRTAQVRADRSASLSRLKMLGMACYRYSADHDGKIPTTLDDLVPQLRDGHAMLTSPNDRTTGVSYVLLTGFPLRTAIVNPAERVLIYENPTIYNGEGTCVLFADGHCQWRPAQAFQGDLDATKKYLAGPSSRPNP